MAGQNSEYAADERDPNWRHSDLVKKLRQLKTNLAIEKNIENALGLADLVSGLKGRRLRDRRSHQELILRANSDTLQRNRKAAAFTFDSAPRRVSSRILSASSRSARVLLAETQA